MIAILPWQSGPQKLRNCQKVQKALFALALHPPRLRKLPPLTAGIAKPVMGHDLINVSLTLRNWLNLLLRLHVYLRHARLLEGPFCATSSVELLYMYH